VLILSPFQTQGGIGMIFIGARLVRAIFLRGFCVFFSVFFISSIVNAGEVSLAWDTNTEPDIAGYRIHYGIASGNYDQVLDVGNTTSCTVSGLQDGQTYYFAATDYNTEGMESGFSNEVSTTISPANQLPVANAGPDQSVNEGTTVTLSGTNSVDPNGGALTYSWSQVSGTPVTLSNPSAAQATFIVPNLGSNGQTLGFQLTVTDSAGLQSSDTCLVTVLVLNQPPTANAGKGQSVNEGTLVTLDGSSSSDPNGMALTYQSSGSSVALSSASDAKPTFLAPSVGQDGQSLAFQLTVTDSAGLQARDFCIVNVVWVNQPPVANAGPDQSVNQGASVTLNGTASNDPDGETITYFWLQTSGGPVTLSDPTSAQPTFIAPAQNSTLVFRLTVTDPEGLSATDQCSIVVNGSSSYRHHGFGRTSSSSGSSTYSSPHGRR
jgi:hypothetical protein